MLLLMLGAGAALAQAPAAKAGAGPAVAALRSPAPGDLIIKFRDGSQIAQALLAAKDRPAAQGEVGEALARSLTLDLGLPLQTVRMTTTREVLLQLDRELLLRQLAERASRDPAVRSAEPLPLPASVLAAERGSVKLELQASTRPSELPARLALPGLLQPQVQVQVPGTGAAAASAAVNAGPLLLQVDFAALVQAASSRLQARPDVAFAEPNRVMQPAAAGAVPVK